MFDYLIPLKDLRALLKDTAQITIDELFIAFGASSKAVPANFPESLKEFYREASGFQLHWHSKANEDELKVAGHVNILPVHEVDSEWKEVLWFDHTPENDPIRTFRILDFFVEEACVGFYIKDVADPFLYYYPFDEEPVNLQVDLAGYIQLLCAARGFRYWQQVLISFLDKKTNAEADIFKEYMPQLFPGFSLNEFRALYEKVKLPKPGKQKK